MRGRLRVGAAVGMGTACRTMEFVGLFVIDSNKCWLMFCMNSCVLLYIDYGLQSLIRQELWRIAISYSGSKRVPLVLTVLSQ